MRSSLVQSVGVRDARLQLCALSLVSSGSAAALRESRTMRAKALESRASTGTGN